MSQSTAQPPATRALVSDSPESYLDNTVRPLSMTSEGRLRVSAVPSLRDIPFFDEDSAPPFIEGLSFTAPSIW